LVSRTNDDIPLIGNLGFNQPTLVKFGDY